MLLSYRCQKYLEVPSCIKRSPSVNCESTQLSKKKTDVANPESKDQKEKRKTFRRPSFNTPDRTRLLNQSLEDITDMKILGRGSFGTVVEGEYKGTGIYVVAF